MIERGHRIGLSRFSQPLVSLLATLRHMSRAAGNAIHAYTLLTLG